MPSFEDALPMRMERTAVVAPLSALRPVLVTVADAGLVEFDNGKSDVDSSVPPRLTMAEPDPAELRRAGRTDLLAGEAELAARADAAVRRGEVFAAVGWCPANRRAELAGRLAPLGASLVRLPLPPGMDPPTALRPGGSVRRAFLPLVGTYGTVPYEDVDPTMLAGVAYVLMFGMMFGDAGHGLMLLACAVALRLSRWRRLARLRSVWPFLAGAGLASMAFGVLYGEFFGPTTVLTELWLDPMQAPVPLLAAAIGFGAVLLAVAYGIGIVNRWREGGPRASAYAPSGIAGTAVFLGLGLLAGGVYFDRFPLLVAGAAVAGVGLVLAAIGLRATAGGGAAGVVQTLVQLFDLVVRLGSNLVSFARLAAFGLAHAALSMLVWDATAGLWSLSPVAAAAAFVVGTTVVFALEALVAGVQALRLEFYELFSRMFETEGRPFRPWHVPLSEEESS
ncbi:MAG TPA: V-type ATPase 116kDa subunit family protein [Kutzneria sp.]|jgi:V/A-type H+-transporting ATPase subunit I|nr:V-type ATPase 116kDa subunit family protein [Kutzneria sp.]